MQRNSVDGPIGWKTIASLLGIGAIIVVLVVSMLGTQVSGILSTVGASVCGPCPGANGGFGNGSGGGTGSDSASSGGGTDTASGSGQGDGSGGSGSGSGSSGSGGTGSGSSGSGVVLAVPRDDVLVIKNGTISLHVAAIAAAVTTATDKVGALGGYVSGSKQSGTGSDLHATLTFRIPSAQWDVTLNAVRGIGEVIDEETSTEDVTTKVVDLGARIRNLEVTEQALQSIMDNAAVIQDVLSVQDELTSTRGEIEQLTSEKAHLEEQAAYSTLTAMFVLTPEPAVVVAQSSGFDPSKEVDAASAKLIRAMQRVARAGIWFGIVWLPILLVLGIGLAVTFVIGRRIARWWNRSEPRQFTEVGGA
jgi:hypothetical protein